MPPFDPRRAWTVLVAAFAVSAVVFTLWPGIDLWLSGLFHSPEQGFWLARSWLLEAWRDMVWNLSIAMFLLSLVGLVAALFRRRLLGLGARIWGFVALLYLFGPILLVNELLKEHWGRARPANTTFFGGAEGFTPALVPSDQCLSNCSFVSGEGSAAVALGVAMLALQPAVARRWPGRGTRIWAVAAILIPVATLSHRIVTGRHFLSDSVFAVLLMLAVALALRPLLGAPPRHRE